MKRVKNIVEKILSDRRFLLKEVSFDYKMSNDQWVKKNWEIFDRGDGVSILLINTNERFVVLSKQFRMPTMLNGHESGFLMEVPAGMIDADEEPENAIIRETKEETGYVIQEPILVHKFYSSPGAITELNYCYIKEVDKAMRSGEGGGLISENEDIELLEVPFSEIRDMLKNQSINDSKTLVLLQYAVINGLLD